MNDVLVPSWIKQIKSADDAEQANAQSAAQESAIASLRIEQGGAEFWRQLLKELAINADCLGEIGLSGMFSNSGDVEHEETCRIQVSSISNFPKQTYTDLFFRKGAQSIRCHTLEGKAFELYLCADQKSPVLTVLSGDGSSHM